MMNLLHGFIFIVYIGITMRLYMVVQAQENEDGNKTDKKDPEPLKTDPPNKDIKPDPSLARAGPDKASDKGAAKGAGKEADKGADKKSANQDQTSDKAIGNQDNMNFTFLLEVTSPAYVLEKIVNMLRNMTIDIKDEQDILEVSSPDIRNSAPRTYIYKICDHYYLRNICLYNIVKNFDYVCDKYHCSEKVMRVVWKLAKIKCNSNLQKYNPSKLEIPRFFKNGKDHFPRDQRITY